MLELASNKKIKRKIGQRGAAAADAAADADNFLELARTAAQTLKAVCTLYEWCTLNPKPQNPTPN